jgi:putative ABC transport system permease protein
MVQELLAVAGIAVGVALLFASQVANTSLAGSVGRLADGLVGEAQLQLSARSPQGFSERLLRNVEVLPGVRADAPVLQRSVDLIGPRGARSVDLIGVDARVLGLGGPLLANAGSVQISGQRGLALPAPIVEAIGGGPLRPLLLQIGDRSVRTLLAIRLQASDVGELVQSPVAIAPLQEAQELAGMRGRIDRILVEARPGHVAEVARRLRMLAAGRLNVLPANFEAKVFSQAESPTTQSTELFSAISALVGFLFAFNAMLLTVPQRRNLIADLRLDGYAPLEIAEVLLFDAVMLGAIGSGLGLLLGDLLSRGLLKTNPGYLSFAFPVGSSRIVSWESIAIASAGGMLAAMLGVTIPLRRQMFPSDSSARRSGDAPRDLPAGALLLGGMLALALAGCLLLPGVASVQFTMLAFACMALAMLLILPLVFRGAVALFDLLQRPIMGVSPRIAVIELQSSSTRARSLAIAATGAMAVFGSVAIEGARQNLQNGLDRVSNEVTRSADIWVSPRGGSNTIATTPFGDRHIALLRGLPGVARVSVYRGGFLDVGDRRTLVLGPPRDSPRPIPARQVVEGEPSSAIAAVRRGGWATLSEALAGDLKVTVGHSFTLPTPVPSTFRLAAITTNLGWSPGVIQLNAEDYARAWGSSDASAYQVSVERGVATASVAAEIRRALGRRSPLMVQSAHQREQVYRATQRQGLSRLGDIAALVLVAAALAMSAAMGAMIWQRRSRLAGMKVDGFDQGELWRALLYESALLLGTGCSVGAVLGLYGQLLLSHALVSVTGFPVVFSVAAPIALVMFAVVTAIAVAIAALPGYFATQVKPAVQD